MRTVARAARLFMTAQAEAGHVCPMTMTNAAVAALAHAPTLADDWLPRIRARQYDSSTRPVAARSSGVTLGMGMTEKQGGSDVDVDHDARPRTPATERSGITGHKWFLSAPMSDAFLVLAQAADGLSCFLMPRFLPDGTRNGMRLPAPQGQARQSLERDRRGRVRRRRRPGSSASSAAAFRRSSTW